MEFRWLYKGCTIITALFLLLVYPIYSVSSGESYNITNVNKCYGDFIVKVRGEIELQPNEYQILGCIDKGDNIWNCKCNNPSTVYIKNLENISNSYDIIIEYYIAPLKIPGNKSNIISGGPSEEELENDYNKRTETFSNIIFGVPPKKEEPFVIPEFKEGNIIIPIIGIVIILLGGIIFLAWKLLFGGKEDFSNKDVIKQDRRKEVIKIGQNRVTEEDVDRYLGK